ncbi:MAG: GNAT family N-acetyltransferase [Clostridiales bacterium]|nr:GNAT family N-acetyltransferase [Clostridiales bacterium]
MKQFPCIMKPASEADFKSFWHMFDNYIIELSHTDLLDDIYLEWYLSDRFRSDFEHRLDKQLGSPAILLITDGEKSLGFCIYEFKKNQCYVKGFFIKSNYRHQGIGSASWKMIETKMRQNNANVFRLSKLCNHCSNFWKQQGFHGSENYEWEKRIIKRNTFSFIF